MTDQPTLHVAVLIACFNRVATTIKALKVLSTEILATPTAAVSIFLVDDASPDGTAEKVRNFFPDVRVIAGTGSLYWNGGMRLAHQAARTIGGFDAFLLLNDDVELDGGVMDRFVEQYILLNERKMSILVGALRGSDGTPVTYSGFRSVSRLRLLAMQPVIPSETCQPCDTFNGNFVLVPAEWFDRVDGLDRHFIHAMGDIDLGLRARSDGVDVILYPGTVGVCDRGRALSDRLIMASMKQRWGLLFRRPFGVGPAAYFAWQHGPRLLWPGYVAHAIASRLRQLLRTKRDVVI